MTESNGTLGKGSSFEDHATEIIYKFQQCEVLANQLPDLQYEAARLATKYSVAQHELEPAGYVKNLTTDWSIIYIHSCIKNVGKH